MELLSPNSVFAAARLSLARCGGSWVVQWCSGGCWRAVLLLVEEKTEGFRFVCGLVGGNVVAAVLVL